MVQVQLNKQATADTTVIINIPGRKGASAGYQNGVTLRELGVQTHIAEGPEYPADALTRIQNNPNLSQEAKFAATRETLDGYQNAQKNHAKAVGGSIEDRVLTATVQHLRGLGRADLQVEVGQLSINAGMLKGELVFYVGASATWGV